VSDHTVVHKTRVFSMVMPEGISLAVRKPYEDENELLLIINVQAGDEESAELAMRLAHDILVEQVCE
jgi:hypothetical protein